MSLHLGGKTPAEMAVSILAESLAVRNGIALVQTKPGSVIEVGATTA